MIDSLKRHLSIRGSHSKWLVHDDSQMGSHLQLVQGHLLFLSHQGDHERPERKIKLMHLYIFIEHRNI